MLTWSSLAMSSQINIIININITTYQLKSSIATSTVSRIPHIHIFFSCLRFTLPKFSNNTSQIRIIILFINNRFIASHLSKALFSKEKLSMQQGQACIPLVRFPNPNYGIKNGKFIINSLHLLWALIQFFFASLTGLSFTLVSPNTSLYMPN